MNFKKRATKKEPEVEISGENDLVAREGERLYLNACRSVAIFEWKYSISESDVRRLLDLIKDRHDREDLLRIFGESEERINLIKSQAQEKAKAEIEEMRGME